MEPIDPKMMEPCVCFVSSHAILTPRNRYSMVTVKRATVIFGIKVIFLEDKTRRCGCVEEICGQTQLARY